MNVIVHAEVDLDVTVLFVALETKLITSIGTRSLTHEQMSEENTFDIEQFQIVTDIVLRVLHGDGIVGPLGPIIGQQFGFLGDREENVLKRSFGGTHLIALQPLKSV